MCLVTSSSDLSSGRSSRQLCRHVSESRHVAPCSLHEWTTLADTVIMWCHVADATHHVHSRKLLLLLVVVVAVIMQTASNVNDTTNKHVMQHSVSVKAFLLDSCMMCGLGLQLLFDGQLSILLLSCRNRTALCLCPQAEARACVIRWGFRHAFHGNQPVMQMQWDQNTGATPVAMGKLRYTACKALLHAYDAKQHSLCIADRFKSFVTMTVPSMQMQYSAPLSSATINTSCLFAASMFS